MNANKIEYKLDKAHEGIFDEADFLILKRRTA